MAQGGHDTLVLASGIVENAPTFRTGVYDGLGVLGIGLEEKRGANCGVMPAAASWAPVDVICTNEEPVIARSVWRLERASLETKAPPRAGLAIGRDTA